MTGEVFLAFAALVAVMAACWALLWAIGGVLAWWAGDDDHG